MVLPVCQLLDFFRNALVALSEYNSERAYFPNPALILHFTDQNSALIHHTGGCTFACIMRRPLAHRLLSLFLAVLVLTASVGLTVQQHTCRLSGRSKASVALLNPAAMRGCGGRLATTPPRIKDNCCDFSSHLHKLNAPAHELTMAKVLLPAMPALWLPLQSWPTVPQAPAATAVTGMRWYAADSSPPPLGGRGLLVRSGKLVV